MTHIRIVLGANRDLANVKVLNLGDDDAGEAGRERRGSYKEKKA